MNIDTSRCPLCKLRWDDDAVAAINECGCTKCGIQRTGLGNIRKVVGNYHILWYVRSPDDQDTSVWLDGTLVLVSKELLPYTITEEQIKMYLTFQ